MHTIDFIQRLWQGCIHIDYIHFQDHLEKKMHVQMSILAGKLSPVHVFFLLQILMCVAAPSGILGVSGMAVFVYLEPAGTSMPNGARPGFVGGVFPAAILFRL